ncbi:MAG: hypothetical protein PHP01_03055 [Phycisphaerae bacterium]|nr:hypothetical protein [Phycisphaerae bacterium]
MKTGRGKLSYVILFVLFTLCFGTATYANAIYDFRIFNDARYEQDQRLNFTVTVSDEGQNQVGFLFENSSSISSSITAIYFDDDSILKRADSILESTGVNFSFGKVTPKSLPAGNNLTPAFPKKPAFSADSDSPTSHNGINPAEWLKITFTLNTGKNLDDVIDAIAKGGTTSQNNLRIGLHIQSLPCGHDSVSAINNNTPIPEPATIALFALGSLIFIKR